MPRTSALVLVFVVSISVLWAHEGIASAGRGEMRRVARTAASVFRWRAKARSARRTMRFASRVDAMNRAGHLSGRAIRARHKLNMQNRHYARAFRLARRKASGAFPAVVATLGLGWLASPIIAAGGFSEFIAKYAVPFDERHVFFGIPAAFAATFVAHHFFVKRGAQIAAVAEVRAAHPESDLYEIPYHR